MTVAALLLIAAVESTCVPINGDMFQVAFRDGKEACFIRDAEDPSMLRGPHPWYGVVRPKLKMVNISTVPGYKGKPCEYGYVQGRLRFLSEGGKDQEIDPSKMPRLQGDVRAFWPTKETRADALRKNDIWKKGGRLRLFSRNPNRTALVLAQLTLIALGALLVSKRTIWRLHWAFWALGLLALQFMAESRGGILAFLGGTALIVYFRFRERWSLKRVGLLALGAVLLVGTCTFVFRHRLTHENQGGRTETSRMAIWREVPRMVAAAPLGWGLWESGSAYNAWFEKPERHHMIGDLFNDHLSRFVEGGFVWGGLYVFAWCLVFCAGWRWACKGNSPVFLALWVAYFIASSFNPMNYWGKSFCIPGLASAVWLLQVSRTRNSWRCLSPGWPLVLTACVLGCIGAVAVFAPASDVPLRASAHGRRVKVGCGEPRVWVADDGFVLCGDYNGYPGRELRQFYAKRPKTEALGLVGRVEDLPKEMERLVLTGTCGEDYLALKEPPKAKQIVFLSPPFGSDKIPASLRQTCDVHLLTGEFAAMRTGDDQKREPWIHVVPGTRVYVPEWLKIVVREAKNG